MLWTICRLGGDTDQSSASSCTDRKLTSYVFSLWHQSFSGNHFIWAGSLENYIVLLRRCLAKAMSNTGIYSNMKAAGKNWLCETSEYQMEIWSKTFKLQLEGWRGQTLIFQQDWDPKYKSQLTNSCWRRFKLLLGFSWLIFLHHENIFKEVADFLPSATRTALHNGPFPGYFPQFPVSLLK